MAKPNGKSIPVDFASIRTDIPVPPPESLRFAGGTSNAVTLIGTLLTSGYTIAVGGTSLIGAGQTVVPIVSIVRLNEGMLRGWGLAIGHPDKELAFNYIDVAHGMVAIDSVFPASNVDFVGTADQALAAPDAPVEQLVEIAQFVFPLITAG